MGGSNMMDLEDRRVTIVRGEDHSAVRVEAVVTGEINGGIIRMETPDPDVLDMDGVVVGMEYFYDGIFLRTTGELEIKVSDPSPYIFVLANLTDPVEIQRRSWVRADLEVDAAIESGQGRYLTRTVDISAGGARFKPIYDDMGLPVVDHGDEVVAVIYLPADESFQQPAGVRTRTSTPAQRGAGGRAAIASRRAGAGSMVARNVGVRATGSTGASGGGTTGASGATATMTGMPTGDPVELPSIVLQSDRKILRLMFTVVSESAAKSLTRAVFDAQVAARRRSH